MGLQGEHEGRPCTGHGHPRAATAPRGLTLASESPARASGAAEAGPHRRRAAAARPDRAARVELGEAVPAAGHPPRAHTLAGGGQLRFRAAAALPPREDLVKFREEYPKHGPLHAGLAGAADQSGPSLWQHL